MTVHDVPHFAYHVHRNRKTAGSAFSYLLRHWFPDLYGKLWVRRRLIDTMARCGKRRCLNPQCREERGPQQRTTRASFADQQIVEIREKYAAGTSAVELSKMYNTSLTVIYHAVTGKTYSWVGGPVRPLNKTHRKLTADQVWSILCDKGKGTCAGTARKYNVSEFTVREIWTGKRHKDIYQRFIEEAP